MKNFPRGFIKKRQLESDTAENTQIGKERPQLDGSQRSLQSRKRAADCLLTVRVNQGKAAGVPAWRAAGEESRQQVERIDDAPRSPREKENRNREEMQRWHPREQNVSVDSQSSREVPSRGTREPS